MGSIVEAINAGQITWITLLVAVSGALVAAVVGGAVGGIVVGGKHMGNELAAMLGSFYGPMGALPGIVIALCMIALI